MQNVSREVVQAAVSLIRLHGQQPRFINFLRQISGTRERPMPNNQVCALGSYRADVLLVFLLAHASRCRGGSCGPFCFLSTFKCPL